MGFEKKSNEKERKALVRVLEIDKDGNFEKEELGFGVKLKKKGNSFFFITSSCVLGSPLWVPAESKIVIEEYLSRKKDQGKEVYKVTSSVDENISFAFCEGGHEDEFLEIDDGTIEERLPIIKTLHAYVFEGKEIVKLNFEDEYLDNNFKLKGVSKKGFQVKRAKGGPIIAIDPCTDKPVVVGIVGIKSDGNLYPVFLTEKNFKVKTEIPKEQGDDTLATAKEEENGSTLSEHTPTEHPEDANSSGTFNTEENNSIPIQEENNQANAQSIDVADADVCPANLRGNPSQSVFQDDQSSCNKFKTINEALTTELRMGLEMKLDPDRPFGGDISSLADKYGYNYEAIIFLKSKEHPTQALLQQQGNSTLDSLRDKLEEIGRGDAADLIDNYIRKRCGCEMCCTGSLRKKDHY